MDIDSILNMLMHDPRIATYVVISLVFTVLGVFLKIIRKIMSLVFLAAIVGAVIHFWPSIIGALK